MVQGQHLYRLSDWSSDVQVLKEYKTSFYKAGLVPAANVYFSTGSEEAKGDGASCLRKEVLALEGPAPSDRGLSQRQQQEQQRAARPAQVSLATSFCPEAQVLLIYIQSHVCMSTAHMRQLHNTLHRSCPADVATPGSKDCAILGC